MEWHFGSRTLLTRQIGFSPTQMNLPLLDTELQSAGKRWMLMPCGWQFPLSSFCVPVISSISYNSRSKQRLWNGYGMSNPSCINDHVSMRGYPWLSRIGILATRRNAHPFSLAMYCWSNHVAPPIIPSDTSLLCILKPNKEHAHTHTVSIERKFRSQTFYGQMQQQ